MTEKLKLTDTPRTPKIHTATIRTPTIRRTTADEAIAHLSRTQQRLANSRQLRTAGLSAGTAARRCRPGGPWQRPLPGVILIQTGEPTPRQRLLAAVLYAENGKGPDADARGAPGAAMRDRTAVLTGEAALSLYGVRDASDGRADVLIGARRGLRDQSYVRLRRTSRWPPTLLVEGIPCVRPVRAASDFAAYEPCKERVRAILAATVQRCPCHPDDLRAELHASHALRNPAVRAVMDELRVGVSSIAEGEARDTLRAAGVPEALWNPTLLTPTGTFLARPDAYWAFAGVALEVDSEQFHQGVSQYRATLRRRMLMEAHGIDVISAVPALIRDQPQLLVAAVTAKLRQAKSRPDRPNVVIRPYK
ncbi:hypothetical protein [Streptomyces paludis]|uniref:DUF559 domain-containing protein n=1 Tax=Streptomyces paludis TaxID=2282738 RepID=A0A345HMX0_9ACTN|nr:hypothetical protein [Streptomyces paludis]AXG78044.1 hypothetical protein DVK44_10375 [Streptomyces paludis]